MIFLILIIGLLFLTVGIGKILFSIRFNQQVIKLFAESRNSSAQLFHKNQLKKLPEPVKRYFNWVLQEGQPYISYARMTHKGFFKTGLDKDWIRITGEQYATTEKPGFIWKGTTRFFVAIDKYIEYKGSLSVWLFSLFKMVDASGPTYNQGELLRWLGESLLYPTNLLPSERLQWHPINTCTAKLSFQYKALSLFFIVRFNETGAITELETQRYINDTKEEGWVIKADNYILLNKVRIPTDFEVLWRLEKGDSSYARFHITNVEYEKIERW